ncbi:MAG TPA: hypothetical protein VK988_09710 [Acidimicrobiales bacterium]|nr:hypothetical protein [Acidimicrobiales bacterium]
MQRMPEHSTTASHVGVITLLTRPCQRSAAASTKEQERRETINMTKKKRHQERRLRVRDVRHDPPDLKKLAGALIALAQAQAETEAAAEHDHRRAKLRSRRDAVEPSNGETT